MAKKEVRAAVLGYGGAFNMGLHHSKQMAATGAMRTVAVCDTDPARQAMAQEELGADLATFGSVDELLQWGEFDLAVIILPHNLHGPVAVQCLKAGKHVVTEKPMCVSIKEATAMVEAAKASGVMLSVFHNRRWDGDFLALREIVESGLIGDIHHVEMFAGGWNPPRGWWRDDKVISGGLIYDWGAHFMYWLLQLIPSEVEDIIGIYKKLVWHDITNEDHTQAIVRFKNGVVADFQQSAIARVPRPRWRVLGTLGGALYGSDHWQVHTEVKGMATEMKVPFRPGEHEKYYANIAAHILKGEKLIISGEDARRIIAIFECAEKSAKTGKPVAVPFG